jgi:predicted AlkP superfamily phosphohydrolase/phosphomutase
LSADDALRAIPDRRRVSLESVFRREDVYSGPYLERTPDVLFLPRDMKYKALGIVDFTTRRFIEPVFGNTGDHRMNGILLARGGPFRSGGRRMPIVSICDLAPTILHLLGQEVPSDMDGRVLSEMLREDWSAAHPVRSRPPYEDERREGRELTEKERREIVDRLKGMGYVG